MSGGVSQPLINPRLLPVFRVHVLTRVPVAAQDVHKGPRYACTRHTYSHAYTCALRASSPEKLATGPAAEPLPCDPFQTGGRHGGTVSTGLPPAYAASCQGTPLQLPVRGQGYYRILPHAPTALGIG